MMFVAGPVLDASAISLTGPQRARRVVLGDVDEGDAGDDADDAATKKQTQSDAVGPSQQSPASGS